MWHAPREVDPRRKAEIIAQLEEDKDWEPPLNYRLGAGDPCAAPRRATSPIPRIPRAVRSGAQSGPQRRRLCPRPTKPPVPAHAPPPLWRRYNAGKMLSRMARVALVAEHVGRDDIARHVIDKLKPLSELYFGGKAANYFLYDHSWGGLISCGCLYDDCGGKCEPHCNKNGDADFCPCFTDPGMDFGNGFYNDHHFHWGYARRAPRATCHARAAMAAPMRGGE